MECAFGILISRWRILTKQIERVGAVGETMVACAVLHYFCFNDFNAGDEWDDGDDDGGNDNDVSFIFT